MTRAIDEDALAEDPLRRHRPVVVGPPEESVASAGNADILLLVVASANQSDGTIGLPWAEPPASTNRPKRQSRAWPPECSSLRFRARSFPSARSPRPPSRRAARFFPADIARAACRSRTRPARRPVGLAGVVVPDLAWRVRARQLAHVADGGVHARIGPGAIEAGNVRVRVFVVFVPFDPELMVSNWRIVTSS